MLVLSVMCFTGDSNCPFIKSCESCSLLFYFIKEEISCDVMLTSPHSVSPYATSDTWFSLVKMNAECFPLFSCKLEAAHRSDLATKVVFRSVYVKLEQPVLTLICYFLYSSSQGKIYYFSL